MNTSTHNEPMPKETTPTKTVNPLFGSWPMKEGAFDTVTKVREQFTDLLATIEKNVPNGNAKELLKCKDALEVAGFYATKAISKL